MEELIKKIKERSIKERITLLKTLWDSLKLKTIVQFAKDHGISYNGVAFRKNLRIKFGIREYIADVKK